MAIPPRKHGVAFPFLARTHIVIALLDSPGDSVEGWEQPLQGNLSSK